MSHAMLLVPYFVMQNVYLINFSIIYLVKKNTAGIL